MLSTTLVPITQLLTFNSEGGANEVYDPLCSCCVSWCAAIELIRKKSSFFLCCSRFTQLFFSSVFLPRPIDPATFVRLYTRFSFLALLLPRPIDLGTEPATFVLCVLAFSLLLPRPIDLGTEPAIFVCSYSLFLSFSPVQSTWERSRLPSCCVVAFSLDRT